MVTSLRAMVKKAAESPSIDRTRLLLKTDELMDGRYDSSSALLFSGEGGAGEKETWDVVTKAALSPRRSGAVNFECSRCGGTSEIGQHKTDSRSWYNWENFWVKHCICGGLWISSVV